MKKIIAALSVCLIIVSAFAGCSDPLSSSNNSDSKDSKTSESASQTNDSEKSTKAKSSKDYEDSFTGLRTYMKDNGFLTDEIIKKADNTKLPPVDGVDYKYGYEYIGAVKGEKYANNGVVIELYEFKSGEKNEYIDSVNKNGTFTLFDKEITAYLTNNDKYMMIYTDPNIKDGETNSDPYKTMLRAVKTFKAFNPTADTKTDTTSETKSETTSSKTSSKTSE